eukprot:1883958-Amphidinium_carterae.1
MPTRVTTTPPGTSLPLLLLCIRTRKRTVPPKLILYVNVWVPELDYQYPPHTRPAPRPNKEKRK